MTNEPTSELDAMPLEQLSEDEQQQMIETYRAFEESEHARDEDISRRGVLAAIGTLIGGSAIGGGAVALSTKEVEAAVAAAGQVGTPSSPVDVYAKTVDTDEVAIADTLATQGLAYTMSSGRPYSDPSSTSSTSFAKIAEMTGGVPPRDEVPAGASLEANLVVKADSVPSGETGTYRVVVLSLDLGGGADTDPLTSIDVDVTDTSVTESGWTNIATDISADDRYPAVSELQAKVTSGTLDSAKKSRFVVLFRWVVD